MDDSTERELRNSIEDARRDVAKLWTSHREVQAVLWGDNVRRDDGLKSRVSGLEARVGTLESVLRNLESRMTRYLDRERAETCLGLKALAEHEATEGALYDETKEGDTEVKVAEMQSKTEKSKIRGTIIAAAITAAFMFAGQAVVATQASATQRSVTQLTELVQTLEAHR